MPLFEIRYGTSAISVKFSSAVEVLYPPISGDTPQDIDTLLENALQDAEFKLKDYLSGARNLLLIIPDYTRRCGLAKILPKILNKIIQTGIAPENISFLIATGTHTQIGIKPYKDLVGDDIMRNFSIVEHNCHKDNLYVGVTSRGTRVEIDRRVLDADRMLAIGGMMPHYFAVFGGGPKLLIPGCASQRCIEQNHKMSLHLEPEWHPGNGPGTLEDNDLIQDIIEGVGMLPKIYHIGIISDENEQPHRIFAGEIIFTYRKMSKLAVNLFGVKRRELAEVVIVSCGGHPKDMELLQAHKSMFHASASLREGGTMIVFAQCSMGIGSKDLEILMEIDDLSDIRQSLKRKYVNNGQALISLMMMGQKYNMKLKTELDDNILHKLNFDRIEENELEHLVEKSIIQGHRVYYFPSASNTIFSKT